MQRKLQFADPVTLFEIDDNGDWIKPARSVPSPNCDERPAGTDIDLLVVHGISLPPGQFGGACIDQLFTNCLNEDEHEYFREIRGLRVSAHLLIDRRGELTQYVPFSRRAWHAGQSCFGERSGCNDFSIGIELEGTDEDPYEPVQYRQLVDVVTALRRRWPAITRDRIVGHCDIAPGRKTDPGPAFDWEYFFSLVD